MESVESLLEKARALNNKKKYAEAIKVLDEKKLSELQNPDLYAEKSKAYFRNDQLELANIEADKALKLDEFNTLAICQKGNILLEKGDSTNAEKYFKRANASNPDAAAPYNGLANVAFSLGDYAKSVQQFEKAIECEPSESMYYSNLAIATVELGDYEKAKQSYLKAIELDKENEAGYNGLGQIYLIEKDFQKAKQYYEQSISLNIKNNHHAYQGLGLAYEGLNEPDKALESYLAAIEINPKDDVSIYNSALIFENKGQYDEAIAYYENYIELTNLKPDYYTSVAKSNAERLKNLGKNSTILQLVNDIKKTLLFDKRCVTHYTSLSTAKALLFNSSKFRLSEGTFLNDTSEGRELFKILPFNFSQQTGNSDDNIINKAFVQKPFIGSFVPHTKHNDLNLWRMYGKEEKDEAKGCSITFEREKFLKALKENLEKTDPEKLQSENPSVSKLEKSSSSKNENLDFYRVAYINPDNTFLIPGEKNKDSAEDMSEKEAILKSLIDKLKEEAVNFNADEKKTNAYKKQVEESINGIAYLFKSSEYKFESEIRLIVPGRGAKKEISTNDVAAPKVYIELMAVDKLIDTVTFGPKANLPEEWAAAFFYTLVKDNEKGGDKDYRPNICISHLPFK